MGKWRGGCLSDVEEVRAEPTTNSKSMTRANKFLTTAGSFVFALSALAVITTPLDAQANEQAELFEQSYCFTASLADRWKPCR